MLDDPIVSTIEHVRSTPKLTSAMRSLTSVDRGHIAMLALDRTWDALGLDVDELEDVDDITRVLARCRVRRLELMISFGNGGLVPDAIAAATRDNPTLVELVIHGGAPRNYDDTWGWRDLELSYIERVTVDFEGGRLEIQSRTNHVAIHTRLEDRQIWAWFLEPLQGKPFASARIVRGRDKRDEVRKLVRELRIAADLDAT